MEGKINRRTENGNVMTFRMPGREVAASCIKDLVANRIYVSREAVRIHWGPGAAEAYQGNIDHFDRHGNPVRQRFEGKNHTGVPNHG